MFSKLFGGKKDGDGGKEFAGDAGELWYIEGKAYDLAKFLKAHPGEPSVDRSLDAFGYTTCLPPCVVCVPLLTPVCRPSLPLRACNPLLYVSGGADVLLEIKGKVGKRKRT